MKKRLEANRRKAEGNFYMVGDFKRLGLVGGDSAAQAVAPFLFVDDMPILYGDMLIPDIKTLAMDALVKMNLPDGESEDDIKAWRKWALRKGYDDPAPPTLMTLEERGVSPKEAAEVRGVFARFAKAAAEARANAGRSKAGP